MNYYGRYFRKIKIQGTRIDARGLPAIACYNMTLSVPVGKTYRRPKDNPAIGFVEGMQFVAGYFNINDIARVAPNARLDLFGPVSSYGERTKGQFEAVVDLLRKDPDTRQAVIVLADKNEPLDQRPCTSSLQFMRVDDALFTLVTMRSSDAIWGMPYDLIQFSIMSMAVAACVGLKPSTVAVNVGNAHIYESTMALGAGFKPWTFVLPFQSTNPREWMAWAAAQSGSISMGYIMENYHFKEIPGD